MDSTAPADRFNRAWLAAWSAKDAEGVAAFYAPDCAYLDPAVPDGLQGRPALVAYLRKLFADTPPMIYVPDAVWPIDGGFCGRWLCTIDAPTGKAYLRGFDLVLRGADGLIARNEVYTHSVSTPSAA